MANAICAVICGPDSWVYVEMISKSKEEWFRTLLDLPNGVPYHDTFGDVYFRLDREQFQKFQRCSVEWTKAVADLLPGEVVAIIVETALSPSHPSSTLQPLIAAYPVPPRFTRYACVFRVGFAACFRSIL